MKRVMRNHLHFKLAAIVLIGLLVRLFFFNRNGIWLDEGYSLFFASHGSNWIWSNTHHPNPPLYYFVLHIWISIFGNSDASARALSLVFGCAAIYLTGIVGKRITGQALLPAVLMALCVFPVHYSNEVRPYSLFLLLSLVSFYFYLRVLRNFEGRDSVPADLMVPSDARPQQIKREVIQSQLGYLFSSIALCYSHNYALFLLIAQNLYALLTLQKSRLIRWFSLQALIVSAFTPWLLAIVSNRNVWVQQGLWITAPEPQTFLMLLRSYFTFLVWPPVVWFLAALVLTGVILNVVERAGHRPAHLRRAGTAPAPTYLLALWLLCPIVIPYVISQIQQPFLLPRYTIVVLPAIYLLTAQGIASLPKKWMQYSAAAVLFVVIGLGLYKYDQYTRKPSAFQTHNYYLFPVQKWREFLPQIREVARPLDTFIVYPPFYDLPIRFYWPGLSLYEAPFEFREKELQTRIAGSDRVWAILAFGEEDRAKPMVRFLSERFTNTKIEFPISPTQSTNVWLYEAIRTSCPFAGIKSAQAKNAIRFDDEQVYWLNFHAEERSSRWTSGDSEITHFRFSTHGGPFTIIVSSVGDHPVFSKSQMQMQVEVNHTVRAQFLEQVGGDFYFSIPGNRAAEVQCVTIHSNTFVPAELKLGDDKRRLGIVFKEVRFER